MSESINRNLMAKSLNFIYKNQICDLCNSDVFEEPILICFIPAKDVSNADQYNCENGNWNEETYPFKKHNVNRAFLHIHVYVGIFIFVI